MINDARCFQRAMTTALQLWRYIHGICLEVSWQGRPAQSPRGQVACQLCPLALLISKGSAQGVRERVWKAQRRVGYGFGSKAYEFQVCSKPVRPC